MAIAPFKFGPGGTSSSNFGELPTALFNFGELQTASFQASLKFAYNQKHLEKFQQPQSYLVIDTPSFKLGYNWKSFIQICKYNKYLGKLQQIK